MKIRLQKILAEAGVASRRKAEAYIAAGRVAVGGQIVTQLGEKADPDRDVISLDGKPIRTVTPVKIYIMMHKPEGVVTTLHDPQNRTTVIELLPQLAERVYPVGRLDYDSSGLLLLTNDGKLTQYMTHPANRVKKTYMVKIKGTPSAAALSAFAKGLLIDGKRTAPCKIRMTKEDLARITIGEGRNRQVRKMCEAIGHPVISLKRVAFGPLQLGDMPRGAWRYLTGGEVKLILEGVLSIN